MLRASLLAACAATFATIVGGSPLAAATDAPRTPRPRPALAGEAALPPEEIPAASSLPDAGMAPLPRPRPASEPEPKIANWAEGAASRFEAAALKHKPVTSASLTTAAVVPLEPRETPSAQAFAAIDSLAPLPRPRPESGAAAPVLALVMPPRIDPGSLVAPEDAACVGRLRALGVEFTEEPALDVGGACAVPRPLNVTELGSGIAIEPEAILNCAATESLARWVKEVVTPSATRLLGTAPTRITHSSTYVCRARYNDPDEKISEHAHANAVDIASFGFADRDPVQVGGTEAGSPEATFEAEVRAGSCTYFTTVLGPGSNAAHATHFHLDMAFRRGGYRLCELGAPSVVAAP